ncbi:uncharacterized protein DUF4363 [Hydrogenispora ethanolica]|jgi:hypothetical protein|uniref:Uncharacterized protein DUF4363 n=1 Tax=Hydrogenispora ethanolica TaxID=1082276 RepID=A0A4R1RND1_HYDET|nr:DUF4363 family protein [Hydrogenispora ethanolica]TCL67342.1 uncharacterized protein DUF4363 [Hydrogenispora ethanolica]
MKKHILFSLILITCTVMVCSCALLRQPLDGMSGFSRHLKETENHIRKEEWKEAAINLRKATQSWYRIKPFLQVDIDHDYVNNIEADFIRLRSNIETTQKADSLTAILLIQDNWKHIGSM